MDIQKQNLPPVYIRQGRECYLDPIRKKLIYITPEETVRQKVISYLIDELKIPKKMIAVEEHLSHYGLDSKKRADIVIHRYDSSKDITEVVAVIECKAPGVYLDERTFKQMTGYADDLQCDYVMMTNGQTSFCYKYDFGSNKYKEIDKFPLYKQMLKGEYKILDMGEIPPRIAFSELQDRLPEYQEFDISVDTPKDIAIPILNFWEALLDYSHKMPTGKYKIFNIIEDYGVRMLSYGNASGGTFFCPYRSFLVDYNGNTEFISIGISTYWKGKNPDKIKTSINVAIDNEKETHHSLQLVVDENVSVNGNKCTLYHHGRIAVGNMGSGKVNELRQFVDDMYPQIICGNRFCLGNSTNDRLVYVDDEKIKNIIENLISYAIVRDEYRYYVKNKRK